MTDEGAWLCGDRPDFYVLPESPAEMKEAKELCARCTSRNECYLMGVLNRSSGIHGGRYLRDGEVFTENPFVGRPSYRNTSTDRLFEYHQQIDAGDA